MVRGDTDREPVHVTHTHSSPNDKELSMAVTAGQGRTPANRPTGSTNGAYAGVSRWRDPRYQSYALMRLAFTVAPIAFGIDKFANVMVDWPNYLAPWINDIAPGSGQDFMYLVGVIEVLAGVAVALKPRYGAYVVAAWLAGIVINLLTYSGFYDIALRDFGLMLAALTLARLASVYDPPLGAVAVERWRNQRSSH
jgi:uncharacterized membrane protein YphA (DoxX/SURF4 family)